MAFNWIANIECEIRDGRAFLRPQNRQAGGCNGACCTCSSFLGVDITQIGAEYLSGSCSACAESGIKHSGSDN